MKIKKLTAHFGALDGDTLSPGEGLTVITAPNEGGKSTWAAFWRAMLYGIDTRERDRAGYLAEKNRYQPWSGQPMSGELTAEWEGREIVVRRFADKSTPFGGFQAVYAGTGEKVPGLTARNLGEKLIGAGRDVYQRSAFVGPEGCAIGRSGELEARVSAMATSGQEDVSYSDVERQLKDWRNRRRLNRSVGLLPELEGELSQVEDALERSGQERQVRSHAREQLARLEAERGKLTATLAVWQRMDQQTLDRRCREAAEGLGRASEELSGLAPPEPELAGWSAQQASAWAYERERAYDEAMRQREEALSARLSAQQQGKGPARVMLIAALCFAVFGLVSAVLNALRLISPSLFVYIGALLGAVVMLSARKSVRARAARRADLTEVPPPPEQQDWQGRAARHEAYLARKARLEEEVRHQRERLEDLLAQGASVENRALDVWSPPELPQADAQARLAVVEQAQARFRDELARAEGALSQLGDPLELEDRRDALREKLARRREECAALDVALEVLAQANSELRRRFSPALAEEAGAIFTALTGGRWRGLELDRDFAAQVSEGSGRPPRSALALSTGASEQLYLAVRLAICQLSLPGAPIFLDDALACFDQPRLERALGYLQELGLRRQVLLFSCQRREAIWAGAHGVPVVELA